MHQQQMSEQESLRLIGEMIGKVKRSYVSKGVASIVWGIVIMVCSLVTWSEVVYKYDLGFDIWLLTVVAIVPQIYFSVKEKRLRKFVGHDEDTMTYVWTAFGISIFILTGYNACFGSEHTTTLFMMLYAIPTFITGGVFKFQPMIAGGVACWLFAVISLYTEIAADMLLMAACGLLAWLLPGIILWNRNKNITAD